MTANSKDSFYAPEVKPPADFILVQKIEISDALIFQNTQYLTNLKKAGLTVEVVDGVKFTDCIFVKLTASDESFAHIAKIHGLYPTYQHDRTIPKYSQWFSFFKTKISLKPKLQDPMFRRCSNSVRGQATTTFTSAERIALISCVLERTRYGRLQNEYGLGSLLANKNFHDAYPLHDSPLKWSESGPLSDRQILAKYWASWLKFYQYQPIHIIYKYYGSEIAFFYAWLQFYTILLLVPTFMGLFTICISYFELNISRKSVLRVEEVCNSNRKICPSCTDKHCLYTELSDYCSLAETVYYLDNNYTAIFAVLMTLWATLFLELWSREEQVFKYKWNLLKSVPQIHELVDYKIRVANHTKYNKFTKTDEYYTPLMMKSYPILYSIIIVLAGILLLIVTTGLILISEYLITYYTIKYKVSIAVDYLVTVMRVYSCLCTIIIIKTYNPLINKISQVLTDREIHRTKNDYMNAYIIKNYVLNFFNTYLMSFYNSFIKEVMFTNPGDYNIYNKVFGIAADLCSPGVGCYFDLSMSTTFNILKEYILLFFINSFLMTHLITGCKFLYKYIYNKLRFNSSIQTLNIPQWEEEYTLKPISSTYFCDAFIDLMMEYGLFVFFSAAVPVLPLLVLLNNIVEIRITARALLRKSRRNIPKPVVGLGAWNNVLRIITRLCYLISGTIICFTSFLINRGVYYVNNEYSMEGFINQSLTGKPYDPTNTILISFLTAAFSVYDFNSEMKQNLLSKFPDVTVCYFNGLKNDFNTTHPYQHGFKYYHLVGIKFIIAVIYVHVVYFLSSIVTFYIPKVPSEIAESIAYDVKAKRTEEMEKLTVGNSG